MAFENKRAAIPLIEQVFLFSMGLVVFVAVYVTFTYVQAGFWNKRADTNAGAVALQTAIAAADLYATASAGHNASASKAIRFPKLEGPYSIELSGREALVQYMNSSSSKTIPAPVNATGKTYSDRTILLSYSPGYRAWIGAG